MEGKPEWYCLDVFSASKSVANAFSKRGWPSKSYDIKTNSGANDITTLEGFRNLILLGLGFLSLCTCHRMRRPNHFNF